MQFKTRTGILEQTYIYIFGFNKLCLIPWIRKETQQLVFCPQFYVCREKESFDTIRWYLMLEQSRSMKNLTNWKLKLNRPWNWTNSYLWLRSDKSLAVFWWRWKQVRLSLKISLLLMLEEIGGQNNIWVFMCMCGCTCEN